MKPATQTDRENIWDSEALRSRGFKMLVANHKWVTWGLGFLIVTTPLYVTSYYFSYLNKTTLADPKRIGAVTPPLFNIHQYPHYHRISPFLLYWEIIAICIVTGLIAYLFFTNIRTYKQNKTERQLPIWAHILGWLSIILPLSTMVVGNIALIFSALFTSYSRKEKTEADFPYRKVAGLLFIWAVLKLIVPFLLIAPVGIGNEGMLGGSMMGGLVESEL